jgi:hypothetical protein
MKCLAFAIFLLGASSVSFAQSESDFASLKVTALTYDDGRGSEFREPARLFFDQQSRELFVADAGNHRIVILDTNLLSIHSFEHYVVSSQTGEVVKGQPIAVVVSSLGELYVIDALAEYVDILDFRGQSLERIYPNKVLGDTSLNLKPVAIAIDESDCVYLILSGDKTAVVALDRDFNLKRFISAIGEEEENFSTPSAIAVFGGKVLLADMHSLPAVKVFDTSGEFISGFAAHDIDREDLSLPQSFGFTVVAGSPVVWIVDTIRQVVKIFSFAGDLLFTIGGLVQGLESFSFPLASQLIVIQQLIFQKKLAGEFKNLNF